MNDEEVSFKLIRLYFEEIARLGFKRQLDLDQILNAYFYTLKKIKNKDEAMRKIVKEMASEQKKEVKTTTVTQTTNQGAPNFKETTTTTTFSAMPQEKSITDIVEEK